MVTTDVTGVTSAANWVTYVSTASPGYMASAPTATGYAASASAAATAN
jgi:hypothetical protein